ncbi:MAG: ABC transporter ATP-binding protein, partial [Candidatus Sulfotelmatobacter sp.]
MATAIRVRDLRKEFRSRAVTTVAVDNIGFDLEEGEILGFLGPNGAGKTTTVKMLCGLVKPTRGTVLVDGCDVIRNPRQTVRHIGAVLEGSRNIYWRLTVEENLEYFAACRGISPEGFSVTVDRLLTTLDLMGKKKALVQTLSRGMQQKVALACALCANPRILLLDEPTLGLDFQSSAAIQREVLRLAQEEGKAILLTTHHMEIARLCTRVAIMKQGRILTLDSVDKLLDILRADLYTVRIQGQIPFACKSQLQRSWKVEIMEDETETTVEIQLENAREFY